MAWRRALMCRLGSGSARSAVPPRREPRTLERQGEAGKGHDLPSDCPSRGLTDVGLAEAIVKIISVHTQEVLGLIKVRLGHAALGATRARVDTREDLILHDKLTSKVP